MILGIDVGGTHTDAVLMEGQEICRKAKSPTNENDFLSSLLSVTEELLDEETTARLQRVVLSTTISTNAIIQKALERVGMFLVSGPGIPQSLLPSWENTHFLSGFVNHRGVEITTLDESEVRAALSALQAKGITRAGVVGKFSPRNPCQELTIWGLLKERMQHISLGHRLGGHLNFPRRIVTTYLNEALWNRHIRFVRQIYHFAREKRITAPIYILKADGGAISLDKSTEFPVQTILSGPAASIMGVLTLTQCRQDAIALDIGGTTTDIALLADGVPLLEPFGVTVDGYKTLIRGLRTKSIGIGGDSLISYHPVSKELTIGPRRLGPAAALGGPAPTPTDAMIVLGLTDIGNRTLAKDALFPLADAIGLSIEETAKTILSQTCRAIAEATLQSIEEVNEEPVYTIHELLEDKKLTPKLLYVVGGPAVPLAGGLGRLLDCSVHIPKHAEVANAVGAALARTTEEVTVTADTERGVLTLGEEGMQMRIPNSFSLADAVRLGEQNLRRRARQLGATTEDMEIEVVECHEFSMIRQGRRVGKTIRVRLQIKPGVISYS